MAFYIFKKILSASTHFACWRGVGEDTKLVGDNFFICDTNKCAKSVQIITVKYGPCGALIKLILLTHAKLIDHCLEVNALRNTIFGRVSKRQSGNTCPKALKHL